MRQRNTFLDSRQLCRNPNQRNSSKDFGRPVQDSSCCDPKVCRLRAVSLARAKIPGLKPKIRFSLSQCWRVLLDRGQTCHCGRHAQDPRPSLNLLLAAACQHNQHREWSYEGLLVINGHAQTSFVQFFLVACCENHTSSPEPLSRAATLHGN